MIDFLIQVASGLVVLFIGWLAASLWNNRAKGPSIAPQFAAEAVLSEDTNAAKPQTSGRNKRSTILLAAAIVFMLAMLDIYFGIVGIGLSPIFMTITLIGGVIVIVAIFRNAMK
jgi:hypothetical protein